MKPRRQPLETKYVHALIDRSETAFQTVRLFRRNVLSIPIIDKKTGKRRYIESGEAGQSDIYAVRNGGRHFEIEVKRGTSLSDAQKRWRDWCRERDIPWMLLDVEPAELPFQTIDRWVGELREFFGL